MKNVFITGASRGIGKVLAEKFLQEGYFVIGTSRNGSAILQHENFLMLPLELTRTESIDVCVEKFKKLERKIDVFVNNAAIWDTRDEGPEIEIAVLRNTLETNLIGPISLCEKMVSFLNDHAHVIHVSSRRGSCELTEGALSPSYSISKAGLNMYTRKLAARLKGKATVSCVHPGSVQTDMNPEGERSAQEAAEDIFQLTQLSIPTGQFWYKGERLSW